MPFGFGTLGATFGRLGRGGGSGGSGFHPLLDLNFVTGVYTGNGVSAGIGSYLACVRSTTKLAQFADGHWASFAINTPAVTDLGILIEDSATNNLLQCRDASNAAWTKSNVTAAKDQTGIDNAATSASSLTATASNGTVTQAVTLVSAQQDLSFFLKRITGTGAISIAIDGSTFTDITAQLSTTAWTRVALNSTLANPTAAIKIAVNGDKIAMDFGQLVPYPCSTSPIATTTVPVARSTDIVTLADPYKTQVLNSTAVAASFFTESQQTPGGPNSHIHFACWNSDFSQLWQHNDNGLLILSPSFAAGFSPNPNNPVAVGTIVRVAATGSPGNVRFATSLDNPSLIGPSHVQTTAQLGQTGILPNTAGGDGVYLGSNKFGSFWNSYIRRFIWAPSQLSDTTAYNWCQGLISPPTVNTPATALFSAAAAATLPAMGVATHQSTTQVPKAIPDAQNLAMANFVGATLLRVDCNWQDTEQVAGVYDFSRLDPFTGAIRGAGLSVQLVCAYGNSNYTGGNFFTGPATAPQRTAYSNWVAAVANHFGSTGFIYEIWNEPNLGTGGYAWAPAANASDYSALLTAAAAAIKGAKPAAVVISGGLSPGSGIAPNTFIVTVAGGTLTNVDGFGSHPYNSGDVSGSKPEDSITDVAALAAAASSLKPIYASEVGYSQDWVSFTQSRRAIFVARLLLASIISRTKQICIYDMVCDGTDPVQHESNFGLFDYNFLALPPATAYASIVASLALCVTYAATQYAAQKVYELTITRTLSRSKIIWGYGPNVVYSENVGAFSAIQVRDVFGNSVAFGQVGNVITINVGDRLSPVIVNLTN